MRKIIAVGCSLDIEALRILGWEVEALAPSSLDSQENIHQGSVLVWSNTLELTEEIIERLPSLNLVVFWGTDEVRGVTKEKLLDRGIYCKEVNYYCTEALAEYVCLLMLSYERNLSQILNGERPLGSEIRGKSIGIIGLGKIGLSISNILLNGFGCKIYYYNRTYKGDLPGLTYVGCPYQLFSTCDYVIISVKGRELLLEPKLIPAHSGAVIVNISRAECLDGGGWHELMSNPEKRIEGIIGDLKGLEDLKLCSKTLITDQVGYKTVQADRTRNLILINHLLNLEDSQRGIYVLASDIERSGEDFDILLRSLKELRVSQIVTGPEDSCVLMGAELSSRLSIPFAESSALKGWDTSSFAEFNAFDQLEIQKAMLSKGMIIVRPLSGESRLDVYLRLVSPLLELACSYRSSSVLLVLDRSIASLVLNIGTNTSFEASLGDLRPVPKPQRILC